MSCTIQAEGLQGQAQALLHHATRDVPEGLAEPTTLTWQAGKGFGRPSCMVTGLARGCAAAQASREALNSAALVDIGVPADQDAILTLWQR